MRRRQGIQVLLALWESRRRRAGGARLRRFRTTEADDRTVRGHDERVSLDNVRFGVEFLYRILERVAR